MPLVPQRFVPVETVADAGLQDRETLEALIEEELADGHLGL